MSNMYVTEPNTEGKVLLHTSFGDLDVELWPQQAPKACRNFVQLCLEGYYDNTIFHRIIKDFMVQGGDPTGSGTGGESVYGEPFIDEFHQRLKFNHRGLVAMANENKPNSNHSQFFFTLDACEFLTRKHTIFGKITGNTIFNLLSVGDADTDANDRPLHPPRLLSAEVLWNPFDDLVPRVTAKKTLTREEEADARKKKKMSERKATKDKKLLSFGDEEEDAFEDATTATMKEKKEKKKKKSKTMMSSHDLLDDSKLKAQVDEQIAQKIAEAKADERVLEKKEASGEKPKKISALAGLKAAVARAAAGGSKPVEEAVEEAATIGQEEEAAEHKSKKRKTDGRDERDEYTKLREQLKRDKKAVTLLLGEKAREQEKAKAAHDMLTPLQQQRLKFLERKKATNRSGRQQETLQKLAKFQATLQGVHQTVASKSDAGEAEKKAAYHGQVLESDDDADGKDGEVDKSWMAAKLKFKKHIDDQFRSNAGQTVDDYMTIDTRDEKTKADSSSDHHGRERRDRDNGRRRSRSRDRRRERSRSRERRR